MFQEDTGDAGDRLVRGQAGTQCHSLDCSPARPFEHGVGTHRNIQTQWPMFGTNTMPVTPVTGWSEVRVPGAGLPFLHCSIFLTHQARRDSEAMFWVKKTPMTPVTGWSVGWEF